MAVTAGVKELEYYVNVLNWLGIKQNQPIIAYQDNKSTMRIVEEAEFKGNSKHFDVSYLYTSERIVNGSIKLEYVKSREMLADGLTKPLTRSLFLEFRKSLGLIRSGLVQYSADQESA